MLSVVFGNTCFTILSFPRTVRFKNRAILTKNSNAISYVINGSNKPSVVVDSLKLLEWDKLCDSVASFAATSLGKQAIKEQLWTLDQSYDESLKLLEETNAAVQMHKYGAMMDFTGIDIALVKSAIQNARRGFPVSGCEAVSLATLLEFVEGLQLNVKAAIKEDADCQQHFMPLSEIVMELVVNRLVVKSIRLLVDDDGTVKDSASGELKQARDQVRFLERKLGQLMESLIRKEMEEAPSLEVSNIDGRWCIRSGANLKTSFQGLLLSSGSGAGSIVEPLAAVPLNDELQRARASVVKAESDVLLKITKMMRSELHEIEHLFNSMIQLDVINARARYSLSFGGARPDLYLPQDKDSYLTSEAHLEDKTSMSSHPTQRKWTLYLPKAYHPLLLQQHRQHLRKATKDLNDAISDMKRRRQQGGTLSVKEETSIHISSLEKKVAMLKQSPPIPVDIFIGQNTRVLVITGPNTGGKTIFLKTVGLAAMMAKSGLYVLSSEPVKIPWFDSVFADIGDEQSLSQSLSTFSGHLKQISEIRSHATSLSLVLLDEVGAGTNPLEGAALGMALLESFAEGGALLTMATTHHGELKTLKYSNDAFENACMEFDEVNLKPTYKILWGVPGRSNAINIAERLEMPQVILDNAREQYGAASAEINEIIVDMERFKQNFHEHIHEGQHHMTIAKDLHQKLLLTREKVIQHGINQRYKKAQEISEAAAAARSLIHKKVRERRANSAHTSRNITEIKTGPNSISNRQQSIAGTTETLSPVQTSNTIKDEQLGSAASRIHVKESSLELPKVGDMVYVSSLNKKAMVLKVDPSKEEIVVQAGIIKLKMRLSDVVS